MNPRRRIIIIILSVATGSLISLYIIKKRMGTLNSEAYMQLGFNFFFAAAIVVGISLLLRNMNKKYDEDGKPKDKE